MKNSKYITQGVWVKVAPENTKEAEEIIWDTVDKFIQGEYREDMEKERKVEIERILSNEFLSGKIADYAERQIASNRKIESINDSIKGIYKVDYDDCVKAVKKYFKREDSFTEITIPDEFKGKIE